MRGAQVTWEYGVVLFAVVLVLVFIAVIVFVLTYAGSDGCRMGYVLVGNVCLRGHTP